MAREWGIHESGYSQSESTSSRVPLNDLSFDFDSILKVEIVRDDGPGASRGVRILSLDGGGFRGVMTLRVLVALEEKLGVNLASYFDLICGTSTGGIMALAISSLSIPVKELLKLYEAFGKSVFHGGACQAASRFVSHGALYDARLLLEMFEKLGGNQPIKKETAPSSFVVCKKRGTEGPFLFRTYDLEGGLPGSSACKIKEAARATSAAPIYFGEQIINGDYFIDGGIEQNNPSILACDEARLRWPKIPIDVLISVGTGLAPSSSSCSSVGVGPIT
jgi:calcium-independent phospholipase A2-gamma